MRVLHVIARMNVGGTARYITNLLQDLESHGTEVLLATGHVESSEIETLELNNLNYTRIPSLSRSINPFQDLQAYFQLKKLINAYKPDIVHSHTFKAGFISRIKVGNYKIVHTFHGHLFEDPTFTGIKTTIITLIEKMLAKKSHKLVVVGNQVEYDLLKRGVGAKDKYLNIPPGINPLKIPNRIDALNELGISNPSEFIVGWLARVTDVKNPYLLVEIAKMLPDTTFLMGGGGDLIEKIKEISPPNLIVLGWVKPESLIGASDLILSTSKNEGVPISLIESQMAGKPVVATNVGGVSDIIKHQTTGILCSSSALSIKNSINALISDPKVLELLSIAAAESSIEAFSISRMTHLHLRLYKELTH